MAPIAEPHEQHDVADRVLRRAQVSKMTRALQESLALANIKIQNGQNGWQNRSIGSIDTALGYELKRKRADTNADLYSDSASSVSGSVFSNHIPMSSPLSGPIFSDDLIRSGSSQGPKRYRPATTAYIHPSQTQHRSKPRLSKTNHAQSWKSSYYLPQSSPIPSKHRTSSSYINHPSFTSETSTIIDSPSASEDDDEDIPIQSFQRYPDTSAIPSSPPRTPSPTPHRPSHLNGKSFPPLEKYNSGGKEGADLLLYLAHSPSPAMPATRSSPQMAPPSTPPSKQTPLPSSSMMTTPGQPLFAFGTPNAGFNFADFCNVTPSPAQKRWNNTPKAKTPMTSTFRRRDGLMAPPAMSPDMQRRRDSTGLGMEFGGQLMK